MSMGRRPVGERPSQFGWNHLAVTDRGLWVVPGGVDAVVEHPVVDDAGNPVVDDDGNQVIAVVREVQYAGGYKVLLSNDGMYVYDSDGVLVTTFGESITYSSLRPQYIGNDDAYIAFVPATASDDAQLVISDNVTMGSSMTLSELMEELSTALQPDDVSVSQNSTSTGYTVSIGNNTFDLVNGTNGTNGTSVTVSSVQYAEGTSGTTAPQSGWQSSVPNVDKGKWLWVKTTYSDGTTATASSYQGTDGATGAAGKGISSTAVTYGKSSDASTEPSSWSGSVPTLAQGEWLWAKTVVTYTDTSSSTSYSKSYIGTDGQDGKSVAVQSSTKSGDTTTVVLVDSDGNETTIEIVDGQDGSNGTPGAAGSNSYVHFAWANTSNGKGTGADFSTTVSSGKLYMGVYSDITVADSNDPDDYSWTLVKGEKGDTGVSVTGVTEYYLATSASSGVSTSTSGWTTSVQAMDSTNKYLWNYEVVTGTGGTTLNTTDPVIIGRYGDKGDTGATGSAGKGISSITNKYLATSASSGVTRSTSGWTDAVQSTTSTNKYLWNYETITYTSGDPTYTDPRIIGTHGERGPQGYSISSVTNYYLATSASSGVTTSTSGWSTDPTTQTMTASNKYLWNYEVTKNSNNETVNTTTPAIIGVYGDKGDTGGTGAAGKGISSITEYYLATSASSGVTTSTSGWSTTVQSTTATNKYLWNYEVIAFTSGNPYTGTPRIIGTYGDKGDTGTSVTVSSVKYAKKSNTDTPSSSDWQDSIPTVAKGDWLWVKTTYSDSNVATTKSYIGTDGTPGRGITAVKPRYYLSTSDSSVTGGSWAYAPQTYVSGRYYWTRNEITWSDGSSATYTDAVLDSAHNSAMAAAATAKSQADSAVVESIPVYYRSTVQSAPSKPTTSTSISNSFITSDAWEYKMPQAKRGHWFFTCDKLVHANGDVTFSDVRSLEYGDYLSAWCSQADNYFIDGGAIYSHSVTADKLAANSITIGKLADEVVDSISEAAQAAEEAKALSYDHSWTFEESSSLLRSTGGALLQPGVYTFEGSARRGDVDITDELPDEFFTWTLRTESGSTSLGIGKTMTVDEFSLGYRATVIGSLQESVAFPLVDSSSNGFVDESGNRIVGVWKA